MTQGGKPVTVLPGLMAMSAWMSPVLMQVNDSPAMMPYGATSPSGITGGRTTAWTTTVAEPKTTPLVARTVLRNDPATPPAVKSPPTPIVPPPLVTDQTEVMGTMLLPASRPTAVNCWVAPVFSVSGFGVTVMVTTGPAITTSVA